MLTTLSASRHAACIVYDMIAIPFVAVAKLVARWVWEKIERFPVPAEEAVYIMAFTGRDPNELHTDRHREQDRSAAGPRKSWGEGR